MRLQVNIEHGSSFLLEKTGGTISLNGQEAFFEKLKTGTDRYLIHYKGKAFEVQPLGSEGQKLEIVINGQPVALTVKDDLALTLDRLGINAGASMSVNEVHAPMPGSILEVKVIEGQEVVEGEPLLVLEAMKMENLIKSPTSGRVAKVHIATGQTVEKKQLLISFEPKTI